MRLHDLCMINPPCTDLVNPLAQVPLGLMYLAAVAERDGLDVTLLNLAGQPPNVGVWRIPLAKVYGITGTFLQIGIVNALANELKRRNHRARVIVGGPISISRQELDMDAIDTVVFGEGESVITDLVRYPGQRFVESAPANVNALPFPARHLWPGPFGGNVFIGGRNYFGGGTATFLTTRGCPYSCAFCAGPSLVSRKVRYRNPDSVLEEMERTVRDYGVRQFRLSDEHFTVRRSHVSGVCGLIRKSEILGHGRGIAWRASIAVNPHDPDIFRELADSGCREVAFGVESMDADVLSRITHKCKPEDSITALTNAHAAGLKTRALMMVGLPYETEKTARLNVEFIEAGHFDAVAVTVFTPVPGCDIQRNPAAYDCEIIPEQSHRSLCVYGPDGKNAVTPTIRIPGMSVEKHAEGMARVIEAAERAGTLGKGQA